LKNRGRDRETGIMNDLRRDTEIQRKRRRDRQRDKGKRETQRDRGTKEERNR
jgi:hypothetical protein